MNEKIKAMLEAAVARRIWQAAVPGIGVKVECYRSAMWPTDRLVLQWPSGDLELFVLVDGIELKADEL